MGIPGVEYFAHPWVLGPRAAKEFLFTGERFDARRALRAGHGQPGRAARRAGSRDARRSPSGSREMPRFGLALTKRAVNQAEDQMGLRAGMDAVFGLHHLAHAHNAETVDRRARRHGRPGDEETPVDLDLDPRRPSPSGDEVRDWLAANVPRPAAARWTPPRAFERAPRVGAHARRGPAVRGVLAARVRRPRRLAAGVGDLRGGVLRGRRAGAGQPERASFLLAPTLFALGTAEQRRRILPRMARGRRRLGAGVVGAGGGQRSAAVRSRAVRTDGGWLLSGQKTW